MDIQPTLTLVQSSAWNKARKVNQTSAAFVDKLPTLTEPIGDAGTATGAAVITLTRDGTEAKAGNAGVQNRVLVAPYGVGADTNTFSMRVFGWRLLGIAQNPTNSWNWVPIPLLDVLCTISSSIPGAGGDLLTTEFMANTIAINGTTGNTLSYEIVSPAAAKLAAHVLITLKGFQKLEFSFNVGVSATSANALYTFI